MTYTAPVAEQLFALDVSADLAGLASLPVFADLSADLPPMILEEAARLSGDVFAPLNKLGDREGAHWDNGTVTLPAGFRDAYQAYAEAGWCGLNVDPAYGGQGLPFALSCAVQEQFTSANMALSLCPMLTQGAIAAIAAHGSAAQQQLYLPKLVSGEWTGTMNLTEPQAGSDVGALRTKAEPHADGSYRIKGSKIFISWGEHDCTDNIIHLVLARLPDAPAGTKGISLFIVPKFLIQTDGSLGPHNDVRCASLEHKMGINASPTCTMVFGDQDDCIGYLIGDENAGMRAMFTMMNHARINVGLQGVAIAERAWQQARAYARDRIQFGPIIGHADVRRMLLSMKAMTEASRALVYHTAAAVDRAHGASDPATKAAAQGLADLLTPVAKACATDMGVEVASTGIQIHGGMGFVEETGAAQHLRDARIAPIYEGTNGIQAIDLVSRKLAMDDGVHWQRLFDEIELYGASCNDDPDRGALLAGVRALRDTTAWMLAQSPQDRAVGATPYLRMFGLVICQYLLSQQSDVAQARRKAGQGDDDWLAAKTLTARFFATQMLPQVHALATSIMQSGPVFDAVSEAHLMA